jgi:hypothetical protein
MAEQTPIKEETTYFIENISHKVLITVHPDFFSRIISQSKKSNQNFDLVVNKELH